MEEILEVLARILEDGSLGGLHNRLVMGVVSMEDQKEVARGEHLVVAVVEEERCGNCHLEGIREEFQGGHLRLLVCLEDRLAFPQDLLV